MGTVRCPRLVEGRDGWMIDWEESLEERDRSGCLGSCRKRVGPHSEVSVCGVRADR